MFVRTCRFPVVIGSLVMMSLFQAAGASDVVNQVDPYVGGSIGISRAGLSDFANTTSGGAGPLSTTHQANNVFNLDYQMGLAYNVLNFAMRSEVELGWQSKTKYNEASVFNAATRTSLDAKVKPITLMANQYFILPLQQQRMQPYVMGGVGVAWNRLDVRSSHYNAGGTLTNSVHNKDTQEHFAWTVGAGLNYAMNERWGLQAGYRYSDYGKLDFNLAEFAGLPQSIRSDRYNEHSLRLSLNFHPRATANATQEGMQRAASARAREPIAMPRPIAAGGTYQPPPIAMKQPKVEAMVTEALQPANDEQKQPSQAVTQYTLQLAVLSDYDRAQELLSRYQLTDKGHIDPAIVKGAPRYIVTYGQYTGAAAAKRAIASLPDNIRKLKPWPRSNDNLEEYLNSHPIAMG